MRKTIIMAASAALLATSVQGQVIDAEKNFTGLDGIASRCIVTTNYKYAKTMCDRLDMLAQEIAENNGISYNFTGKFIRLPKKIKQRKPLPPLTSNNLKAPLLLEFLIKGTKTPSVGASISITAYIEYKNAVEKNNPASLPRSGKLIMWRSDITGYGPARRLAPAMPKALESHLREFMEAFAAAAKKTGQKRPR